jgi:hypothetical protein
MATTAPDAQTSDPRCISPGGRAVISKVAARAAVAAFALAVIVSISTASTASATPSIPIPPPVSGPGLHGR